MHYIVVSIICLSIVAWIYLLLFRGGFWLNNEKIDKSSYHLNNYPSVCAIVPARNEATFISTSLKSLLEQNYSGNFSIILVDDQSTDNTKNIAKESVKNCSNSNNLHIISGVPLISNWSGKLWAIKQGIDKANQLKNKPDYFLLTDADIEHHKNNLEELVTKAKRENLALVSLMVKLKCESLWEKLLIPAFIFFFKKLYPFAWVNNYYKKTAAAAGGCILISRSILEEIGGVEVLRETLIDDCSLAAFVKKKLRDNKKYANQGIWLGLSEETLSLRSYDRLEPIWNMVARTAYTQLNHSPFMLVGTLVGLVFIYLIGPVGFTYGLLVHDETLIVLGIINWFLMTVAYMPTIMLYECSPLWALSLPFITSLYAAMTFDSALNYWRGKGGRWKGRTYS
ncbi:glycosyltransferase [Candidatus Atelocyanobacterium thalassae]|uniref:Glycosyltransferase 2-like domain-containing protein n=1 Tax=cyanobacterium endosymbiont of Braarudosphaera bigelowii TaxID=1285375 RepID=A0ABN6JZB4_9CHRO|nr:glycosyltransferase [Candidatus Atelocyanobacterium thalassa]BDA39799.1 hypothetical protein CPARK_000063900 [cyanobacterium endosymbiont of Braarudosphaera bigelowii]